MNRGSMPPAEPFNQPTTNSWRPAPPAGNRFNALWWLHPCWPFAGMLLASLSAAYFISESDFRYFWRTSKLFGLADLKIGLYTVGAFLSGAMGITLLLPPVRRASDRVLNTVGIPWIVIRIGFWAGVLLTIFGYICWV